MLDKESVAHEVSFWKDFVKTPRFDTWCDSSIITPELNHLTKGIFNLLLDTQQLPTYLNVVDVGSGPVSILNGFDGIVVRAVDPLADEYAELVDYNTVVNKVYKEEFELTQEQAFDHIRPMTCAAEDLASNIKFHRIPEPLMEIVDQTNTIVHCSNALDHVYDVESALKNFLHVAVRDESGYIIIQGFCNEADAERGQGFHKWNLNVENEDLVWVSYDGKVKGSFFGIGERDHKTQANFITLEYDQVCMKVFFSLILSKVEFLPSLNKRWFTFMVKVCGYQV